VPDAHVIYVDPRSAAGLTADTLTALDQAEKVVAAVYVIPTAGRAIPTAGGGVKNSVAMADATGALPNTILEHVAQQTTGLAKCNPYLAKDFPSVENYLCTFSNATVSETAVVKVMFGEIPTRGHLPVTIPGIASRGAGLEHFAQLGSGGSAHARQ